MDISSILSEFTSSDKVDALSKNSGANPNQVSSLIEKAIPILMKGMQQNANSESGAESLAKALDNHANNDISNAESFVNNIDINDSSKMLNHILGSNNEDVQAGLAKKVGVSSSQASSILSSIAPMLLSFLGSRKQNSNTGSNQLSSMLSSFLGNSGGGLNDMISSALADKDGDGSPDLLEKLGGLFGHGNK